MPRKEFLNDLSRSINAFPNRFAVIYGPKTEQMGIRYCSLGALSSKLCHFFKEIFKSENNYVCLNINTRLYLLPILVALWRIKLAAVCVKCEDYGKKVGDILKARFIITDQKCNFTLNIHFEIMSCRFYVYELCTEPVQTFPSGWDMCYAVFTSGSTGLPKMVQIPWSCIYPNVRELVDILEITENDVIAWQSPSTFDPFLIELMGSLARGACLMLEENIPGSSEVGELCWEVEKAPDLHISVLQTTPSIYKSSHRNFNFLRVLLLGGEILPKSFISPTGVRVFNIYGITEISCWSFIQEIKKGQPYSIGKPLNGIVYKIENDELWIGSESRKCVVESELPENLPQVLFRPTGDLVEFDGQHLFVVDRTDNVVKVFGNKVSLSQLYGTLDALTQYDDHYVVFDQVSHILALFLVDTTLKETHLRISADTILSKHPQLRTIERPDVVFKVSHLPLNSHGKIDRTKLKELLRSEMLRKFENSRKTFERLWCEILGLKCVPPDKTFTQCGGDSVTGLKFLTRLDAINVSVSSSLVTKLLGSSTFCECCSLIEEEQPEGKLQDKEHGSLLSVRWSFNMKKCVDAAPSLLKVDGTWCVCVGSHSSQVSLLEVESGRHLWSVYLGDRVESGIAVSCDHSRLFTGCYDQHIYCIDVKSGDVVWKFRTGGMVKSTPRLSHDDCLLFCGSYDKQMYCLDALDGSLKSSISLNGSILATPVLCSTFLLFATLSGECCAVETKSLLCVWRKVLNSPVFSSPCSIHNSLQVLFAEVEGHVHCFQVSSGKAVWKIQCGGNIFSGLVAGTIENRQFVTFGCHDRHIYLLDVTRNPVITSKIQLDSPIACAPSITNRYLAAVASEGFLYVIDLLKMEIASRLEIGGETFSSPQWHDQTIFFGSRNDNLMCVDFNRSCC